MVQEAQLEHESQGAPKRMKQSGALDRYAEALADGLEAFFNGQGDDALAGLLHGSELVWHDSIRPGHSFVGVKRLQAVRDLLRGAVPDLVLRVSSRPLHTGEEGVVLGYWTAQGTHKGPLGPDLPASGAAVSWEGSVVVRTRAVASSSTPVNDSSAGTAPQADSTAAAEAEPAPQQTSAAAALEGVEVWWSWDPVFLFRQMGWKESPAAKAQAAEGEGAAATATAAAEAEAAGAGAAAKQEPLTEDNDLGLRTAAAARRAYATEAEAVEAAAAAVAASAAAAEKVGDSAEALAAAQAANRAVVELYFHTYNTGHYGVLDHIVDPEYQYDGLLDLGTKRGRAAMSAMMGGWRDCVPDLAIGHELFVGVGGDRVTFRWVIRGTHSTPGSKLLGVPAGGATLHVMGVTTLTLRGGRICRKISHANAAALEVARAVPDDEGWPVARRLLTAGLVLRRLRFGPLPPGEVALATEVLLTFFDAHRRAAQSKQVLEFLHVSKAGGTTFCQLAEKNGCRTKGFKYGEGNCLIPRFNDRPHWLDPEVFQKVQLPGYPSANCNKVYFARPQRDADGANCFQRRKYMLRKGWNMYANEYTAYGGEEAPEEAFMCHSRMLTVMQLRHPISRIASNIKHMFTAIAGRCTHGDTLLGLRALNGTRLTPAALLQPPPGSAAAPRFATAAFWEQLAPAVTVNYYTRVLLGQAAHALPAGDVGEVHGRLARLMLVQFAVMLLLDDPDLEAHTLKYGMGWRVHSAHANRRDSAGGRAVGLPDDMDLFLQLNQPDMQVYRFGVVLARLDAIMYDMAYEAGVDVSRAGASTSAAAAFAASLGQGKPGGAVGAAGVSGAGAAGSGGAGQQAAGAGQRRERVRGAGGAGAGEEGGEGQGQGDYAAEGGDKYDDEDEEDDEEEESGEQASGRGQGYDTPYDYAIIDEAGAGTGGSNSTGSGGGSGGGGFERHAAGTAEAAAEAAMLGAAAAAQRQQQLQQAQGVQHRSSRHHRRQRARRRRAQDATGALAAGQGLGPGGLVAGGGAGGDFTRRRELGGIGGPGVEMEAVAGSDSSRLVAVEAGDGMGQVLGQAQAQRYQSRRSAQQAATWEAALEDARRRTVVPPEEVGCGYVSQGAE
ncbi:hypothetical protein HXX76_003338 [Chlamydomonas incerta]|uniref:SnoaL-like domain-containing protein n=1 Tax=Chlamydomonas incerta TaxID=51695 RepID=A0A835TE76_CHLIN|nr:hypothetical protein HXX76_003338 [Chlamydomonas incerta]|eukprot:KAG2441723.1 hypothetical protein HXX76_003338 [Chlamydomonas incerta]